MVVSAASTHAVFLSLVCGWFGNTRKPPMVMNEGPKVITIQCV